MDEVVLQARAALEMYLQRGQEALSAFRNERTDVASRLLMWRRGAFVRFQRLDALAQSRQVTLSEQRELVAIWQAIKLVDDDLATAIRDESERLQREMLQFGAARAVIGKYRSGSREQTGFQSTI